MNEQGSEIRDQGSEKTGLNLVLVYGLIALGFLIAAGCAVLIVLPFYHRR
ncbi:hypothetical protein [Terracidiphilus gabretensis]|nr:hypothetical protein [Terracidiphilus gabretensis]